MGLTVEIIRSVRTLFSPAIEAHYQRRTQEMAIRHRTDVLQLERHATNSALLERDYPLGSWGRVRAMRKQALAPCLIVSPIDDRGGAVSDRVANAVSAHVCDIDRSGAFLHVITGAFVRDTPHLRTIHGDVGAHEIAEQEFTPAPSMVVYFEWTGRVLVAKMLLSHVLPTVNGDAELTMPLAQLGPAGLHFAMWNDIGAHETDLEWVYESVDGANGAGEALLAEVIADFAGAVASLYWQLQGVRWRVRDEARAGVSQPVLLEVVDGNHVAATDDEAFADRMEQEIAGLVAADMPPQVWPLPDGNGVGVYLELDTTSVLFTVDVGYPQSPPVVHRRHADGSVTPIALAHEHWEPSRSIVELASALR